MANAGQKLLSLSDDGTVCAVGGGDRKSYFYVIDLESKAQHKLCWMALMPRVSSTDALSLWRLEDTIRTEWRFGM